MLSMASFTIVIFLIILLFKIGLFSDIVPLTSEIHERDFCEQESLDISCGSDEVIVMYSASFGRFKLGVCAVTQDFGHVGCRAMKMHYLDQLCSGKKDCHFKVADHKTELSEGSTCPDDLDEYLKVEYRCVKVFQSDATTCLVKKEIPLTPPQGYLASAMTQLYGIGSQGCPYTISIPSGRKLRLTIVSFSMHSKHGIPCARVGNAIDSSGTPHPISLCPDKSEETEVSDPLPSGDIQIEMVESSALKQAGNFLLKYEVIGCADPPPQPGRYTSRQSDQLTVKCNQTGETRYLICKGDKWSGDIQDCPNDQGDAWIGEFSDDSFPIGILIIVSIGVALGVFVGGLLLIVIAAYMKSRKQKEQQRKQMYMIASQDCSDQQFRTLRSMSNNQDLEGNPDCVQCTLQRTASAKHNTPKEGSTYYPASSVDGSIKDYSMFERGNLKDSSTPAQNANLSTTRTILPGSQPKKAHMYEHPKYTP